MFAALAATTVAAAVMAEGMRCLPIRDALTAIGYGRSKPARPTVRAAIRFAMKMRKIFGDFDADSVATAGAGSRISR